jgi:sulfoxide reductase heme-binding subunit YedZ
MLGLFSYFYASLHLAAYVIFDQFFDVAGMVQDLIKRPFIAAGLFSFSVLAILAATSTKSMIRKLGIHWKPLHRLVYLAAISGVLHYLWLVKRDITDPGLYIIVLCGLLISRLTRKRSRRPGQG